MQLFCIFSNWQFSIGLFIMVSPLSATILEKKNWLKNIFYSKKSNATCVLLSNFWVGRMKLASNPQPRSNEASLRSGVSFVMDSSTGNSPFVCLSWWGSFQLQFWRWKWNWLKIIIYFNFFNTTFLPFYISRCWQCQLDLNPPSWDYEASVQPLLAKFLARLERRVWYLIVQNLNVVSSQNIYFGAN